MYVAFSSFTQSSEDIPSTHQYEQHDFDLRDNDEDSERDSVAEQARDEVNSDSEGCLSGEDDEEVGHKRHKSSTTLKPITKRQRGQKSWDRSLKAKV